MQVTDIEIRLEMKKPHDLMDHVQVCVAIFLFYSWPYRGKFIFVHLYTWSDGFTFQLYLLGLPNKLGPLGFLALHHVLTEEEEVDVAEVDAK